MSLKDLELNQQPIETQQLIARMREIEARLLDGTPGIIEAMVDIHKNLQQHEELVLLMSDEDIRNLHLAHEKHKQFRLIENMQKELKKKKKLTDDDLKNL